MNRDGVRGYARRAEFYAVEYRERRDIPFWLSQLRSGEDAVLEIPCGVGRLTLELARKARHVTAVDIEPHMIEVLRNRVERCGLADKICAINGDLTSLNLNRAFDLIAIPREALQLLPPADASRALSRLVAHLLPGGRLIVDVATFAEGCSGDPDYFDVKAIGEAWIPQWTRGLDDGRRLTRSFRIQRLADRMRVAFTYEIAAVDGRRSTFADDIILYHYDATSLSRLVPPNVDMRLLGEADREIYECKPQARLIVVITASGGRASVMPS